MKKRKIKYTFFYHILLLFALFACRQRTTTSVSTEPLKYDSSLIAIFKWDTARYYSFPKNSDPFSLTQHEMNRVDSLFSLAVANYNDQNRPRLTQWYSAFKTKDSTSLLINPKGYKRQYFPYKDVNGEKIVYINCFCIKWGVFAHWKEVEESVDDGGNCYFQMKINLTKKNYFDFFVNGYG